MDNYKLIETIKLFPQIWDRTNTYFRERELKERAWEEVGSRIGATGATCREAYKSLREKYLREREKSKQLGVKHKPWKFLSHLQFLDDQIVTRRQGLGHRDNAKTHQSQPSSDSNLQEYIDTHPKEFSRALIELVKESTPLWDRTPCCYPSKQIKIRIWNSIAETLSKDVDQCMLRWKALREKYIREKVKHDGGGDKWEFLDAMSFLDRVIQYRKKTSQSSPSYAKLEHEGFSPNPSISQIENSLLNGNSVLQSCNSEFLWHESETGDSINENSTENELTIIEVKQEHIPDSSNDSNDRIRKRYRDIPSETSTIKAKTSKTSYENFTGSFSDLTTASNEKNSLEVGNKHQVSENYNKTSENLARQVKQELRQIPDSSYDVEISLKEKSTNVVSENMIVRKCADEKTPEQLFGDLVASMLAKKNEREKNVAMIDIMKILTK